MIRIWGDFNSIDLEGRIALDAKGSLEDIHKLGRPLRAGESVIVYDDSYQAEGTLDFRDGVWLARIDWKTGRDTLLVGLAEEMNRWGYPPLGLGRAMARVVIRLVRHVSRGEPVALNEIANVALEAGAPSSAVQQLVRRLCEMDHGRIVGIAGLSQRPYPFKLDLPGRKLFAWCGLDAVVLNLLIGEDLTLTARCPETDAEIRMRFTRQGLKSYEPKTMVFRVVSRWPRDRILNSAGDILEVLCRRQPLFANQEALVSWSRK